MMPIRFKSVGYGLGLMLGLGILLALLGYLTDIGSIFVLGLFLTLFGVMFWGIFLRYWKARDVLW